MILKPVQVLFLLSRRGGGGGGASTDLAASSKSEVETFSGPFSPSTHVLPYWGRKPVVVRRAFAVDELMSAQIWPSWQDIVDLACTAGDEFDLDNDDDGDDDDDDDDNNNDNHNLVEYVKDVGYEKDLSHEEWFEENDDFPSSTGDSARLIRHTPGQLDSFQADMGPFTHDDLEGIGETQVWSLLMNDVDRYRPSLAAWMDQEFGFLPRWRRDDAQISIAPTGGGIGPHVDSYDVFLIQAAGTREWRIQPSRLVSVREEMDRLLPDLSVRILAPLSTNDTETYVSITLQEGDVLYLPPRVTHWGISTSDDCMTLSVGCRAPSAQEMVARLAEQVLTSNANVAVRRYSEDVLKAVNGTSSFPSLTPTIRQQMKEMVRAAVENALDDERSWDLLLGKLITEPKRLGHVVDLEDESEEYRTKWGTTPEAVLSRVQDNPRARLQRTAGISYATSRLPSVDDDDDDDDMDDGDMDNDSTDGHDIPGFVYRLYAGGLAWEVANDSLARQIFACIDQGSPIRSALLVEGHLSAELKSTLLDLIAQGYLKAAEEP